SPRAGAQPLDHPGACVPLQLLRHAQDAFPHARARVGRLSRRLRDDGRAVRGADADPDRENGADSSGPGRTVVLEPRGRLRLPGRRGLHRTRGLGPVHLRRRGRGSRCRAGAVPWRTRTRGPVDVMRPRCVAGGWTRWSPGCLLAGLLLTSPAAAAGEPVPAAEGSPAAAGCTPDQVPRWRGGTVRLENDMAAGTDSNYTNGAALT